MVELWYVLEEKLKEKLGQLEQFDALAGRNASGDGITSTLVTKKYYWSVENALQCLEFALLKVSVSIKGAYLVYIQFRLIIFFVEGGGII